ncbi:MAG TPA: MFS transporter [Flavobacteriales bacterium]|nr:MFS transporter [Flavobacteriales bacterium]
MSAINFTAIMDFMIMMPLGDELMEKFSLDSFEWSLVVSSYTFTAAVSALASIFLIDKFDRKKSLLFLYAGFILGTLAVALSNTYETLLISRSVTGLFGGIINAVTLAIVSDLIPYERRAAATGIIAAGFSAAAALGVPFGLYLGVTFNWHFPFYAIVGISSILWIVAARALPVLNGHLEEARENKRWDSLKNIFSDGNQLRALALMMVLIGGHFMIVPFLAPYMITNVGFADTDLSYIYFFGGTASIFTSPIIGRIADKYGKKTIFLVVLLVSLIPIYFITNLGPTEIYVVLIITTVFFIFAGGRMAPITAVVISTAPPRFRGSFLSVRASMQNLAAGLAAVVSGMIVNLDSSGVYVGYDTVGLISIGSGLATLLILRFVVPKY